MRSRFRLELDVVLDTDAAPSVIEAARQHYVAAGVVATVEEHGSSRTLSAKELIDEIEDALMELSEGNPLLADANVEVEGVVCRSAVTLRPGGTTAESAGIEPEASIESEDLLDSDETEDDPRQERCCCPVR